MKLTKHNSENMQKCNTIAQTLKCFKLLYIHYRRLVHQSKNAESFNFH